MGRSVESPRRRCRRTCISYVISYDTKGWGGEGGGGGGGLPAPKEMLTFNAQELLFLARKPLVLIVKKPILVFFVEPPHRAGFFRCKGAVREVQLSCSGGTCSACLLLGVGCFEGLLVITDV